MKKLLIGAWAVTSALGAAAQSSGQDASLTTDPSPAISNKPLTITITTATMSGDVFLYSWCFIGDTEKAPWKWDAVNTSQFKMTPAGGAYSFTITDIQQFYGLSDSEMEQLTKLGFIAKNASGSQCKDQFCAVEQGRRDAYSGGEGTAADPFIIANAQDLADLAAYPRDWDSGICFRQTASIDASTLPNAIGSIGSPFKGSYDGGGYSIKNASISGAALGQCAGLFGAVDGADIHDLAVTGITVEGANYVGGLVGYAKAGTIARCYVTGAVTGSSISVGGLVGLNNGATITDCYSAATVTAANEYAVGGLVGKNLGSIKNTYATGAVTGKNYVGGLVGANYASVSKSMAVNSKITGAAAAAYVARFGGNNNAENKSDGNLAYQAMNSSAAWAAHGDHASLSADPALKATYQSTLGWDFTNVWKWVTVDGHGFPALAAMKEEQANPIPAYVYDPSSILDPAADSAADSMPEYFNLQGVRVSPDRMTPGIYIRVQGGNHPKSSKIIVQ